MINNWKKVYKVNSLPLVESVGSCTLDNNMNTSSYKLEMTEEEKAQSTLVNHSLTMSYQCEKRQTLP